MSASAWCCTATCWRRILVSCCNLQDCMQQVRVLWIDVYVVAIIWFELSVDQMERPGQSESGCLTLYGYIEWWCNDLVHLLKQTLLRCGRCEVIFLKFMRDSDIIPRDITWTYLYWNKMLKCQAVPFFRSVLLVLSVLRWNWLKKWTHLSLSVGGLFNQLKRVQEDSDERKLWCNLTAMHCESNLGMLRLIESKSRFSATPC